MNAIKKKYLLLGMLTQMTSLVLTGCGETNYVNTHNIYDKINYYDDNTISGDISYEEVEKALRIVTFECDGEFLRRLMIKDRYVYIRDNTPITRVEYIDLETGTCMYIYRMNGEVLEKDLEKTEKQVLVGKTINIYEEVPLIDYLIKSGKIEYEYTVSELLTFYQEEVEPNLEELPVLKLGMILEP